MQPSRSRPVDLSAGAASAMAVGGALLVASAFLTWLGRGAGSALSLRELGDFLLRDRWSTVPRWTGLLAYVIPVCGGLSVIAAGLTADRARRLGAVLGGIVGGMLLLAAAMMVVRDRVPAAGFLVAVAGDAGVLVGTRLGRPRGRTDEETTDTGRAVGG